MISIFNNFKRYYLPWFILFFIFFGCLLIISFFKNTLDKGAIIFCLTLILVFPVLIGTMILYIDKVSGPKKRAKLYEEPLFKGLLSLGFHQGEEYYTFKNADFDIHIGYHWLDRGFKQNVFILLVIHNSSIDVESILNRLHTRNKNYYGFEQTIMLDNIFNIKSISFEELESEIENILKCFNVNLIRHRVETEVIIKSSKPKWKKYFFRAKIILFPIFLFNSLRLYSKWLMTIFDLEKLLLIAFLLFISVTFIQFKYFNKNKLASKLLNIIYLTFYPIFFCITINLRFISNDYSVEKVKVISESYNETIRRHFLVVKNESLEKELFCNQGEYSEISNKTLYLIVHDGFFKVKTIQSVFTDEPFLE
ncbi:hypothetical protein [Flammeovirga sp. EKP202]|uniref:hypothetical protein n=1 Tax=Flammeovirga sp. EKP202 TaxID=2770592 RepID=UPI00165F5FC3|nr:hypothetical protein [Flammeovirga sp. EKP202]MBD0404082.1 hypothetical protein [Flammeovirga sp. EKP202]